MFSVVIASVLECVSGYSFRCLVCDEFDGLNNTRNNLFG